MTMEAAKRGRERGGSQQMVIPPDGPLSEGKSRKNRNLLPLRLLRPIWAGTYCDRRSGKLVTGFKGIGWIILKHYLWHYSQKSMIVSPILSFPIFTRRINVLGHILPLLPRATLSFPPILHPFLLGNSFRVLLLLLFSLLGGACL